MTQDFTDLNTFFRVLAGQRLSGGCRDCPAPEEQADD